MQAANVKMRWLPLLATAAESLGHSFNNHRRQHSAATDSLSRTNPSSYPSGHLIHLRQTPRE